MDKSGVSVWGIILAAGESRRMGQPKQLLPLGQGTMLEEVIQTLLLTDLGRILVVLGYEASRIAPQTRFLDHSRVQVVINPDYRQGMFSSVQAGFKASDASPDAFLVALGDQPFIGPEVIASLLKAYGISPSKIVIPTFQGKRGHPIIIDSRFRDELLAMPITSTLHHLLSRHAAAIADVPQASRGILEDVDDEADYARLVQRHSHPTDSVRK